MSGNPPLTLWDIPAVLVSALGLAAGIRLAFFGRLAKGTWKRLIEAIVVAVLTSSIIWALALISARPLHPGVAAAIGVAVGWYAFYISKRYETQLYGWVGGGLFAVVTLLVLGLLLPWLLVAFLGVLAFGAGYTWGIRSHAWVLVFGTAYAGAGSISSSFVGVVQVLQGKSHEYLRDELISYVIPIVAKIMAFAEAMSGVWKFVLYLGSIVVFVVAFLWGLLYQAARIDETPPRIDNVRTYLKSSMGKMALPALGGLLGYGLLFYGFRLYE